MSGALKQSKVPGRRRRRRCHYPDTQSSASGAQLQAARPRSLTGQTDSKVDTSTHIYTLAAGSCCTQWSPANDISSRLAAPAHLAGTRVCSCNANVSLWLLALHWHATLRYLYARPYVAEREARKGEFILWFSFASVAHREAPAESWRTR